MLADCKKKSENYQLANFLSFFLIIKQEFIRTVLIANKSKQSMGAILNFFCLSEFLSAKNQQ